MYKIFIILINLIAANIVLLSVESHENADAVFFGIKYEYILDEDGSWQYSYEHRVKLLTYFAINRYYGESFIVYNPKWQKLTITGSNTKMVNGKIVSSPPNAFNEVLPGFASNIAPYNHLREMVVTHTGLEIGATIEFGYSLKTIKGFLPGMMGKIIIGDRSPIEMLEIVIKIPVSKNLNFYLTESDKKPEVIESGGIKTFKWVFRNIPLVEVEEMQPPFEEFLPVLYFSTASEDEVINHIIGNEHELFALDEAAVKKIKEITNDKLTDLDKVTALRDYVERNVGQMNCDLIYTGYKAMKAQETFDRNVGSQLDKVVLLTAMLKAAGYSPVPLIGAGSSKASDDISLLLQFIRPFVYCEGVSPFVTKPLLDPNHNQKDYNLLVLKDTPHFLLSSVSKVSPFEVNTQENNFADFICIADLDTTLNLKGRVRLSLNGSYNPDIHKKAVSDDIINHYENYGYKLQQSGGEENPTDSKSNSYYYELITGKPFVIENGMLKINFPDIPNGFYSYLLPIGNPNRTTPIKLPQKVWEKYDVAINLAEGFLIRSLPKAVNLKNRVGYVECNISLENNRIEIKKELEFYSQYILPEYYNDFLDIVKIWKKEEFNELLIDKRD